MDDHTIDLGNWTAMPALHAEQFAKVAAKAHEAGAEFAKLTIGDQEVFVKAKPAGPVATNCNAPQPQHRPEEFHRHTAN